MTKGDRKTARRGALAAQMERDLRAIRRAMGRPLESEIARSELTVPQMAVMREVVASPGIRLKDLGRAVSLAHSTASGIVDRLEKRGMIERRTDPEDGRVSRIYPAAVVTGFVRDALPALQAGPLQTALARARAGEREEMARAVGRLRELLEQG
ncbi:MAG TPA: MarR family transcriptional regulator [Terracidiphilus sp.]|nr:MarR family transcriptional regulator [Terracidiphilus sp.]